MSTFILKRKARLYTSTVTSSFSTSNTIKTLVSDVNVDLLSSALVNYSRQTVNSSANRKVNPVLESVGLAKFSFTTYVDVIGGTAESTDRILWQGLLGTSSGITQSSTLSYNFANSNVPELNYIQIWLDFGNYQYELTNCVIDSANISLDLNNQLKIEWSGTAMSFSTESVSLPGTFYDYTSLGNCIVNKLTTISLERNSVTYNLAITGGSIGINNNNVYYGRKKIGFTQEPVGHYTGQREISGNLGFYLKATTNNTADLFNNLFTDRLTETYEQRPANITLNVGGTSGKRAVINLPETILDIPKQRFEDVISVSVPFVARENSGNEVNIIYYTS